MKEPIASPRRLSSLSEGENASGVGHMFREARALPDEEFPRLRWRLRTSQQLRAVRSRVFLRVALVVGVAFFMGGIVGAVVSPFSPRRKPPVVVVPSQPVAPLAGHRKLRSIGAPATGVQPAPITEAAAPITEVAAPAVLGAHPGAFPGPRKTRAATRVAMLGETTPPPGPRAANLTAPPEAAPEASPIAVEQSLVGHALRTLRRDHDGRAALALLTQHEQRFPQGAFAAEARMLRIEALLSLGEHDEALTVLDSASLASLPNPDEQRVVRGELRAAHQRWREAAQDFNDAIREGDWSTATPKVRNIQERALWGRAATRSRLGDQDGARADLQLYLKSFPDGLFARPAAGLLKRAP